MDLWTMPISIRDRETDGLAREVAALTGETITDAIGNALRERLVRERARRAAVGVDRLLAIGDRCAAHMGRPFTSADIGELLYNKQGLPR